MTFESPDIYFAHIPKTAGSSVASFVRAAYPAEHCMMVHEWRDLVRMDRRRIGEYRCYTGHFGASFLSLLDRDVATLTFLRDPVERSVSHIKHAERDHRRHRFRYLKWTIRMALAGTRVRDEWIKPPLRYVLSDLQTRSLGLDIDLNRLLGTGDARDMVFLLHDAQRNQAMETVLERARRRLDSMTVVGVTERFGESMQLVSDLLRVPLPEHLPEENAAPGHTIHARHRDSGEFSNAYIREIESMNRYDQQLYAYANQLLDQRLATRPRVRGEPTPATP